MSTATIPTAPEIEPDADSGVWHAPSASQPGVHHTLGISESRRRTVRVSCTCPAGRYARPDRRPIPCRHGRALIDHLLWLGAVEPHDGAYFIVGDPFAVSDPAAAVTDLSPVEVQVEAAFVEGWRSLAEQLLAAIASSGRGWADAESLVRAALEQSGTIR